jgi:hypothetical protein
LPHYFLEFDVFDTATETFLCTAGRRELLADAPVVSVHVLHEGPVESLEQITDLIVPSLAKGPKWRDRLMAVARERGLDTERVIAETDRSDFGEGLYIKVEEEGRVVERLKYVRADFLATVLDSGTHWLRRPIVPNQLADDVDLFGSFS